MIRGRTGDVMHKCDSQVTIPPQTGHHVPPHLSLMRRQEKPNVAHSSATLSIALGIVRSNMGGTDRTPHTARQQRRGRQQRDNEGDLFR